MAYRFSICPFVTDDEEQGPQLLPPSEEGHVLTVGVVADGAALGERIGERDALVGLGEAAGQVLDDGAVVGRQQDDVSFALARGSR